MAHEHYDFIVIGSGFGGSVSALRLSEKGYRVLVIEKGKRFSREDFPKNNSDFKRWYWMPSIGATGIFKLSVFKHITVAHGVGVGGGSLVYACTLPTPSDPFFMADSWGHLADWKRELAPHYETALKMLGAAVNEVNEPADRITREIAAELGREEHFEKTRVSIFFGEPGKEVSDPYFGGKGPSRVGCTECGACMTGCRVGAKNTLDQNYLYLAERLGCEILPETEVMAVREAEGGGYQIETDAAFGRKRPRVFHAEKVIFAGGVLGTVPLLLKMREERNGLPKLSPRVGDFVRTNSESILCVTSDDPTIDHSRGIAISSILHTDEHSHFEPVRYGSGSNFYKPILFPHAPGSNIFSRVMRSLRIMLKYPGKFWRMKTTRDLAARSTIMLYMRTLDETIRLKLGRSFLTGFRRDLMTTIKPGAAGPVAFMEEATDIARRFAEKTDGLTYALASETLLGTGTTAHILGGACMGSSPEEGAIDPQHRLYGYDGLYVIDGAAVSANPGVNPSLTITALAERAMSFIPNKHQERAEAG